MENDLFVRELSHVPEEILKIAGDAQLRDFSCSKRFQTYFVDSGCGLFLKTGPKGKLLEQAELVRYFSEKGFTAPVIKYVSTEADFLLMARVSGESGIHPSALAEPDKLCGVLGESLRRLHDTKASGCPIAGVTSKMIAPAKQRYLSGNYDAWMLEYVDISDAKAGYELLCANETALDESTHIHGDACLPNIMLNKDFSFSGFIDFEGGGMGDRHFDLLWAVWSLSFNLKTNAYKDRFLDAYGRDAFDLERFKLCGILQALTY